MPLRGIHARTELWLCFAIAHGVKVTTESAVFKTQCEDKLWPQTGATHDFTFTAQTFVPHALVLDTALGGIYPSAEL